MIEALDSLKSYRRKYDVVVTIRTSILRTEAQPRCSPIEEGQRRLSLPEDGGHNAATCGTIATVGEIALIFAVIDDGTY